MLRNEATPEASLAAILDRSRFGMAIAAMTRMIATTIKSSIREKPFCSLIVCHPGSKPLVLMPEHRYFGEQSPCQSPSFSSEQAGQGSWNCLIINSLKDCKACRVDLMLRSTRPRANDNLRRSYSTITDT